MTGVPIDALRDSFLNAPFDLDGWDRALRLLASATGAARSHLLGAGGDGVMPLNYIIDPPPGFLEDFIAINGGSPAVNWRVAASGPPLEIRSEHHYAQARALLRSQSYDALVDRFDMMHGCQTVLQREGGDFIGLATLRTRRDGKTRSDDRTVFANAIPFVSAATRMQQALDHQAALLMIGALEAMHAVAVLLDRSARVTGVSGTAEAALCDGQYLCSRGGFLAAADSAGDAMLQRAIAALLDGSTDSQSMWLISPKAPRAPRRCELFVLPRREWSFGNEPRLVVVLRAAADIQAQHGQLLTGVFGLTAAEVDVAMRAANGANREEIASARDTSPGTVAMQIKSIFQKLDVRREAELVALLNRLLR